MIDEFWLYTLSDQNEFYDNFAKQFKTDADDQKLRDAFNKDMSSGNLSKSGLYIYDLNKLLSGKIETYKLTDSIVGHSNRMDVRFHNSVMAIIKDFHKISILPIAHRNVSAFK
jgi:hypothetical protein